MGTAEEPEHDASPDDDADYEYMEGGAQKETGETQALGPATEEQAAELHGTDRPERGANTPPHVIRGISGAPVSASKRDTDIDRRCLGAAVMLMGCKVCM